MAKRPKPNPAPTATASAKEGAWEGDDFVCLMFKSLRNWDANDLVVDASCGAISTFVGTTRDHFDGKKVVCLEYEAYVPMAVKKLRSLCDEVRTKWRVGKIAILHRLGPVDVKEASVVIAISSAHRKASLEAVHFAIDQLKATVPIWKKEMYEGGTCWKQNAEFDPVALTATNDSALLKSPLKEP